MIPFFRHSYFNAMICFFLLQRLLNEKTAGETMMEAMKRALMSMMSEQFAI